jgi:hypothetical protein
MMYASIEGVKLVIIRISFGIPGPGKNHCVGTHPSRVDAVLKNSSILPARQKIILPSAFTR